MAPVNTMRRFKSELGAELIEFALVVPLLLFVILGLIDFGFMFQRFEVVTNSAREGARIAVLPGYSTADVEARVRSYLTTGGVAATTSNTTVNSAPFAIPVAAGFPTIPGMRVVVTYQSPYLFLGPIAGWFGGSFTTANLTGVAIMRNEL